MLPISWRAAALDDLSNIVAYIATRNPLAAEALYDRVQSAVVPLSEHPYLYKPGREAGTREIVVHPNYVVVYRVTQNCVEVTSVLHARQQYP